MRIIILANIFEEKIMKNTRKILVLLLSFALFVAGFSVMAFAEEKTESSPYDETTYKAALAAAAKTLEFYEAGTYFELRVNGSDVTMNESDEARFLKGGAYSESVSGGVLSFNAVNPSKINLVQNTPASFGVNLRGKVTAGSPISLYAVSAETGDYICLFSVGVNKITHKFNPTNLAYEEMEVTLAEGEFFDLSIYVEKGSTVDTVNYTFKPDGAAAITGSYSYSNDSTDFLAGKFKFDSAYISAKTASFAYVEMYPGTYQRFVDNSKNVDLIADDVTALYEAYLNHKDVVEDGAFALAEVIAKIAINYTFPVNSVALTSVKNTVDTAFADCVKVVSPVYAENVLAAYDVMAKTDDATTEALDESFAGMPYNDRLDTVNKVFSYEDYMTKLEGSKYNQELGIDFDKINASIALADEENVILQQIEEDTIFVIEATELISNIYLVNYEVLKTVYEAILDVEICDTYYSELYPEHIVLEAVQKSNMVKTDYPALKAKAEIFVNSISVAADATRDFASRYNAYVIARNNVFTDTTYNKYLSDITISELNKMFEEVDAEMNAVSEVAEAFLSKIREAALTPSYTVKIIALDAAKPYLTIVETGYPEVADAIDSYYAMRKDVEDRKDAAKIYIQAVLNIQAATSVSAKLEAIEIAEKLAVLGSENTVVVEGMSITVSEANVIFANEASVVELFVKRIENYVNAVNAIAKAADLLSRRQAINAALALKENVANDAENEEVASATATLDAAILAYNNSVKVANKTAEESESTAVTVMSKTVATKPIAEIVAIIKKFDD